jgi:integrase
LRFYPLRAILASTVITKTSRKLRLIHPSGSTSVARRRKFQFTKAAIEALPSPENGQRAYYYDRAIRGLAVAVSPAGKKVYILYRKIAGRPERVTIGPCCDLSIEQARHRAEEMNGLIARGENPADKRRTIRDEMSLGELFDTYLERHAKIHNRTWKKHDLSTFNLHLSAWRLRRISTIRKIDVVTLHSRIGRTRGPYAANRLVELLCAMFNRAREWGWQGENPAAGVKAFKERKRERFLQAEELPAFFESLAQELNTTIRDYILVSLLTGARRANVQEMRWPELNLERAVWSISAEQAKGNEPLSVTLSPVVIRVLENRKASSTTEWVFPGNGKTGHLVEPKTAWKRILKRAGLTDLRLHDLRRTLGSWQAATGASLPIIGKSLGHKSLAATQVYARLNLDPVRASVNLAGDAMLLAGGQRLMLEGRK